MVPIVEMIKRNTRIQIGDRKISNYMHIVYICMQEMHASTLLSQAPLMIKTNVPSGVIKYMWKKLAP